MTNAGAIETERLILRPHRAEDIAGYLGLWLPPTDGPAYTPVLDEEGAWARLLRLIGHRTVFGSGPFLVTEKAGGAIVGEVGFAHFRRGMGADFDGAAEAMWILTADRRGRGHAREAMTAAVVDFDARGGGRSVCMIEPTNAPSLALATRLGWRPFRRGLHHGTEVVLFERDRV